VAKLKTDTDTVPWTTLYFVNTYLDLSDEQEIDYVKANKGELIIKHNRDLYELNFDINSEGELIVIGEDAENYSIDQDGYLAYTI
jgi:hypothetical protein